jgi:hypothetical protein
VLRKVFEFFTEFQKDGKSSAFPKESGKDRSIGDSPINNKIDKGDQVFQEQVNNEQVQSQQKKYAQKNSSSVGDELEIGDGHDHVSKSEGTVAASADNEEAYSQYKDYNEINNEYESGKVEGNDEKVNSFFDPDNLEKDVLRGMVFKQILDKPRAKKHYRPPTKR